METFTLNAKARDIVGKQVARLRREGLVPAIVYGTQVDPKNVSVDYREFDKIYHEAGESSLVDLVVGQGKPVKVLIQDVQYEPVKHRIIHADFRQVDMNEEIETDIELTFVGEAPAVKVNGAILVRNMDSVTVRCLPSALVSDIEVDLGMLKEIGDHITVADLTVPEGITFVTDPAELVAGANEPISQEELEALDKEVADVDVSQVQVAGAEEKAAEAEAKEEERSKE